MHAELRAEGLRVQAGDRLLLRDAALRVPAGTLTALVGPSGAGKSTLGRAMVGLVSAHPGVTAGSVTIGGDPPLRWTAGEPPGRLHGAGLAWSPQDAWGGLSPFEPVGRALRRAGAPGPAGVAAALERVGLDPSVARVHPHTLSGGMARRAALAVALAGRPRFLIADEPTAGLDPTVAEAVLGLLRATADQGVGVLLLGHDLLAIRRHAARLLLLDGGQIRERVAATEPFRSALGRALDAAAEGPPWR